jgi:hypothetical protein
MRRAVLSVVAASLMVSACATTHTVRPAATPASGTAHPGRPVDGSFESFELLGPYTDAELEEMDPWSPPLPAPRTPVKLSRVQATPVTCPSRRALETPMQESGRTQLAPGVELAAVVMCQYDRRRIAGQGAWTFTYAQRATEGLSRMARALRQGDSRSRPGLCRTDWEQFPWIAVVTTDGRVLRPRVPEDTCGRTRGPFQTALAGLRWVRYDAAREKQTASEERLMRHRDAYLPCLNRVPDRLASAAAGEPLDGRAMPRPPDSDEFGVTLCRYAVGTGADRGRLLLQHQTWLGQTQQRRLVSGFESTTEAPACALRHTDVVSVYDSQGRWILVERDGCRRVLSEDGLLGQASDDLLRAVGVRV